MKPSIGRIVHYVTKHGKCRPAIIVDVVDAIGNDVVNLHVFTDPTNDDLSPFHRHVDRHDYLLPMTEIKKPHTWHWPEHFENE